MAEIDFDSVYRDAIRPAIEIAGMQPIRADEERTGGIIHKPMFERLLLADFAVADLTTGNANVFYELGVRHAARPATTVAIFAEGQRLPFDLTFLRALPYKVGAANRFGAGEAADLKARLSAKLQELRPNLNSTPVVDSPLFQLVTGFKAPETAHLKTDLFRERVQYSESLKKRLEQARETKDLSAVDQVETELEPYDGVEPGVLVDLYLTWRALGLWDRMIQLYEKLPYELKRSVLIREQLGFAQNRAGRKTDALATLEAVLAEHGPSPETLGLIGRIYKDKWTEARESGQQLQARGYLEKAIGFYLRGFEADSRDFYPGINAVTLLDIKGGSGSEERVQELLPIVRYALKQRIKSAKPNYWDYATLLELAVLDNKSEDGVEALSNALACAEEPWQPVTTANNLRLIQEARRTRGMQQEWVARAIQELDAAAKS